MNTTSNTQYLPPGFMIPFYIMMFVVPALIIALSLLLALNTKLK